MEREIRRYCRFSKLKSANLSVVETEYFIYHDNIRFNVSKKLAEIKNRLYTEYVCLDGITLEPCYTSQEIRVDEIPNDLFVKGSLYMKKTYFKKDTLIFYSIHNLESLLSGYDRLIVELEDPFNEYSTYKELAFRYSLDTESRIIPMQKVKHISPPESDKITDILPKVDGFKGRLIFFDSYVLFNGDFETFVVKDVIELWGREFCFFLKGVELIAEKVDGHMVIIDIANDQLDPRLRLNIIENMAKVVRRRISCQHESKILFQKFDAEFISKYIKTDGEILLSVDGDLLKYKPIPTIDLQYVGDIYFQDRNGVLYVTDKAIDLKLNSVYECVYKSGIVFPLKIRNDKFHPNSRQIIKDIIEIKQ